MSIWQTKKWQEMLKKSGQISDFFEIPLSKSFPKKEKDFLYVEKRSIGLKQYWLFILGIEKEKISKEILKKLEQLTKKQNCIFCQIEFIDYKNLKSFDNLKSLFNERKEYNWFNKWYYKKFITPYTAIIDLTKSEDEILANMKPKWRYNIKLAKKKEVEVEIVEKSKENIKAFYDLMLETTRRDGFSGNNFEYYKTFLSELENSKLILAKKDWIVIAWWIFIFDKDVSIYYYWASTSKKEYRNFMAPYLVQWQAITYAKSIWSKIYDFLWVASPDDKNSSLVWVTDFKKKLTKNIIKVSESYIFINNKFKYFFISLLRKLKSLKK